YELAARRLIERLGEDSRVAAQLDVLIVHLGNRVDRIVELLCALLAKRDQWLHPVIRARATENLRETLEGTLRRLVERHLALICESLGRERLEEIMALLRYSADQLLANPELSAARRKLLEAARAHSGLDSNAGSLDVWRAVAGMLFKQDGELY